MKAVKPSVYLAGRYGRLLELSGYAEELKRAGIEVTSRWLDGDHRIDESGLADAQNRTFALEDIEDIEVASHVVFFSESNGAGRRGGRHFELGFAYARGKRVIVVGARENVFHYLPRVSVVSSFYEAMRIIRADG